MMSKALSTSEILSKSNEFPEDYCKTLYPFDLKEKIHTAQQLKVSFSSL